MKLPGFFNKEIYDFLDVAVFAMWAVPLALLTTIIDADGGKHYEIMAVAEKDNGDDKEETVFDSSQQAPAKMVYTILNNLESSKLTRVEKRNKWKASPNQAVASPLDISGKSWPLCINITQTSDSSDSVTFLVVSNIWIADHTRKFISKLNFCYKET